MKHSKEQLKAIHAKARAKAGQQRPKKGVPKAVAQIWHKDRAVRSRRPDETSTNKRTITSQDKKVHTWRKNPGAYDVIGVDAPSNAKATTTKTTKAEAKAAPEAKPTRAHLNQPGRVWIVKAKNGKELQRFNDVDEADAYARKRLKSEGKDSRVAAYRDASHATAKESRAAKRTENKVKAHSKEAEKQARQERQGNTPAAAPDLASMEASRQAYANSAAYWKRRQRNALQHERNTFIKNETEAKIAANQWTQAIEAKKAGKPVKPVMSDEVAPGTIRIKGDAYPVRRELKALGADFDKKTKTYTLPEGKASEAMQLLAGKKATIERSDEQGYNERQEVMHDLKQRRAKQEVEKRAFHEAKADVEANSTPTPTGPKFKPMQDQLAERSTSDLGRGSGLKHADTIKEYRKVLLAHHAANPHLRTSREVERDLVASESGRKQYAALRDLDRRNNELDYIKQQNQEPKKAADQMKAALKGARKDSDNMTPEELERAKQAAAKPTGTGNLAPTYNSQERRELQARADELNQRDAEAKKAAKAAAKAEATRIPTPKQLPGNAQGAGVLLASRGATKKQARERLMKRFGAGQELDRGMAGYDKIVAAKAHSKRDQEERRNQTDADGVPANMIPKAKRSLVAATKRYKTNGAPDVDPKLNVREGTDSVDVTTDDGQKHTHDLGDVIDGKNGAYPVDIERINEGLYRGVDTKKSAHRVKTTASGDLTLKRRQGRVSVVQRHGRDADEYRAKNPRKETKHKGPR